jgi:hypothetical protein
MGPWEKKWRSNVGDLYPRQKLAAAWFLPATRTLLKFIMTVMKAYLVHSAPPFQEV